jgi:hypothetical protein
MKTLGDILLTLLIFVGLCLGGSIVIAILFAIWVLSVLTHILSFRRPPTIKELYNL